MKPSTKDSASIYVEVLYRIEAIAAKANGSGVCVALTSVNPGEGVSFTTQALAQTLAAAGSHRVRAIPLQEILEACANRAARGLLPAADSSERHQEIHSSTSERKQGLVLQKDVLREKLAELDVLLVDCPALRGARRTIDFLPYADGVLLVVGVGKATKGDIVFAERQIVHSGSNFEGYILNKGNR